MIDLVLQKFEIESPEAVVPSEPCTLEKFVQKSAFCRLTGRIRGKAKKKKLEDTALNVFLCSLYSIQRFLFVQVFVARIVESIR